MNYNFLFKIRTSNFFQDPVLISSSNDRYSNAFKHVMTVRLVFAMDSTFPFSISNFYRKQFGDKDVSDIVMLVTICGC